MKKTVIGIVMIVVCLVAFFIIGFIFKTNIKQTEGIEEKEEFQEESVQTSEISSSEEIALNGDIEATKRNSFVGIIAEVNIAKKEITVENPSHLVHHEIYHADNEWRNEHKVIINEQTYVKAGYLLCLDNVPIKDYNGNTIEIRDLRVGDTINVSTKNVEYVNKLIFEALTSENIVFVERK